MPKYVSYAKVKQHYNVSAQTVQNWARRGSVRYKTIQNDTRKTWLYDLESIGEYIKSSDTSENTESKANNKNITVIYARVSSSKQKPDLERQKELLLKSFPDAEVMFDIGSGINFKRPSFRKLVTRVCRDEISTIVVTYKDRLARFGYELFEQLCNEHSTKILVYSKNTGVTENDEDELKEDLLSIVNVFVAKSNGKRSGFLKHQRKLKELENKEKESLDNIEIEFETESKQYTEDTLISNNE